MGEAIENKNIIEGKIMKVLCRDGEICKLNHLWNQNIKYIRDSIKVGISARLYEGHTILKDVCTTSIVKQVEEDENNLIITTQNSIYYIKKFFNIYASYKY